MAAFPNPVLGILKTVQVFAPFQLPARHSAFFLPPSSPDLRDNCSGDPLTFHLGPLYFDALCSHVGQPVGVQAPFGWASGLRERWGASPSLVLGGTNTQNSLQGTSRNTVYINSMHFKNGNHITMKDNTLCKECKQNITHIHA